MTINPFIENLIGAGVEFYLDPEGKLRWRSPRPLTKEERQVVRAEKDKIIELLVAEAKKGVEDPAGGEDDDIFSFLAESIESGGPYVRVWPQIKNYVQGQVQAEQFRALEAAWVKANAQDANRVARECNPSLPGPGPGPGPYPNEPGLVKCGYCSQLKGDQCSKGRELEGIALLRKCEDYLQTTKGERT